MTVYGVELRQRVVDAYKRIQNKRQVCLEYNIARTTLDDWLKLEKEQGHLKQEKWASGRKHYIQDWDAFKTFVEQATFNDLNELRELYNHHFPIKISKTSLYYAVQRIGYTRKKRVSPTNKPIGSTNTCLAGSEKHVAKPLDPND